MRFAHIFCGWSKRLKPNESRRAFIRSAWLNTSGTWRSALAAPKGTSLKRPVRFAAAGNSRRETTVFIVEMYTPGEIIEARKPFDTETAADALLAAKAWINDSRHNATNFRVIDLDGIIIIDKLVAELK
jgi:hypothetical protein